MTTTILRGQSAPVGPYVVRVVRVEGQHVTLEVTWPAAGARVREAMDRLLEYGDLSLSQQEDYVRKFAQIGWDGVLLARHLRDALASPPPTGGEGDDGTAWRAIETAPKDGTQVLGVFGDGAVDTIRYSVFDAQGRQSWTSHGWEVRPTHWLPLPAPPQAHDRAADALRRRGGEGNHAD